MCTKRTKRKRPEDEDTAQDYTAQSKKKKKTSSKKSTRSTESDPVIITAKQAIVPTKQPNKQRKSRKTKTLTKWEEAYSTDTPAEHRARRKAVKEILNVNDVSDGQIEELLAKKQEYDLLRRLAIFKRMPCATSVDKKDLESKMAGETATDCEDTSDEDEETSVASILGSPKLRTQTRSPENKPASVKTTQSWRPMATGMNNVQDKEAGDVLQSTPAESLIETQKIEVLDAPTDVALAVLPGSQKQARLKSLGSSATNDTAGLMQSTSPHNVQTESGTMRDHETQC